MSDSGTLATVSEGGFSVTSNSETVDQIRQSIAEPDAEPDPEAISQAASELGKKGAAASAEARAKAKEAAQESASDAPPEEEEPEPEPEPEKLGKPRHDPKARMLEATRQAAEAKREREAARAEAEAAKKEAAALKAQLEAAKAPKEPAKQAEGDRASHPSRPIRDDFASDDDWVEAVADWKAEEKLKARDAKAEQDAKVKAYADEVDKILAKAVEARTEYEKTDPAWFKKVSPEVKAIVNTPSIARDLDEPLKADHVIADEIILSGAAGPRLTLHLSDHPDELQRLRALPSPTAIQVEMRILARSLNGAVTAGAAPKGEVSKANPPVRPVTGSPHIADVAPDDSAPYDEHRRYYNAKEKARAR